MAELMKLIKETAKEVNVMSAIEWQAIQEACEATREETLEEAARNHAAKNLSEAKSEQIVHHGACWA